MLKIFKIYNSDLWQCFQEVEGGGNCCIETSQHGVTWEPCIANAVPRLCKSCPQLPTLIAFAPTVRHSLICASVPRLFCNSSVRNAGPIHSSEMFFPVPFCSVLGLLRTFLVVFMPGTWHWAAGVHARPKSCCHVVFMPGTWHWAAGVHARPKSCCVHAWNMTLSCWCSCPAQVLTAHIRTSTVQ
jgi:hypothetical protein